MLNDQTKNTLQYYLADLLLQQLFTEGLLTKEEAEKINQLNVRVFQPELPEIYE